MQSEWHPPFVLHLSPCIFVALLQARCLSALQLLELLPSLPPHTQAGGSTGVHWQRRARCKAAARCQRRAGAPPASCPAAAPAAGSAAAGMARAVFCTPGCTRASRTAGAPATAAVAAAAAAGCSRNCAAASWRTAQRCHDAAAAAPAGAAAARAGLGSGPPNRCAFCHAAPGSAAAAGSSGPGAGHGGCPDGCAGHFCDRPGPLARPRALNRTNNHRGNKSTPLTCASPAMAAMLQPA